MRSAASSIVSEVTLELIDGQSNGLDPRIDEERDLGFDDVPVSWPEPEPLLSSFGSSMFGGDWSSKRWWAVRWFEGKS